MKYPLAIILLLLIVAWLAGCATTQDFMEHHPRASAVIAASVFTSIALSTNSNHHNRERIPDVSAPLVACDPVELCR